MWRRPGLRLPPQAQAVLAAKLHLPQVQDFFSGMGLCLLVPWKLLGQLLFQEGAQEFAIMNAKYKATQTRAG